MTRLRYLSSNLEWVSHQDFTNIAYVGFFRHFVCVFVFVVVFAIVFVFVFVSSYDFWITFIISFQNMYGYRGLWGLWADIMIIFEVMTDTHTDRQTRIPLIDSAHPVGLAEWKRARNFELLRQVPESPHHTHILGHWFCPKVPSRAVCSVSLSILICIRP